MPSFAHIHLMIVHFPVVGSVLGLVLYTYALRNGNQELRKVSLILYVFLGIAAGTAFLTGLQAEEIVEDLMGVSKSHIEEHEQMAIAGLAMMVITGSLALLQLIWSRFSNSTRSLLSRLTLMTALVGMVVLIITANRGGKIRHSELRPGVSMPATLEIED